MEPTSKLAAVGVLTEVGSRRRTATPSLQDATGASIKKLVRPLRTVHIDVGGRPITAAPQIIGDARALFDRLLAITAPG
ncbi:hypothetical protein K1T35_13860 [Pseudonocardia sp. DSM 110487]|uniref:hypothetical protein n=1 Tax=Pseudonocardia sp. DSM 110487 TaxID=2865833 RepID=UPI001C6A5224|nr:hypothetical protein [Pseudonocardia sp. DSM 110487]QYN38214.1 hypothetical protein K1T35_13860 [Pseudonocardia sp. DSM 110487]